MFNSITLNSNALDGIGITGNGSIVSVSQSISGQTTLEIVISFVQNVGLGNSGSGTIISFDQSVQVIGSGIITALAQKVEISNSNTFFNRNKYDCEIYINGVLVPKSQICDQLTVRKSEGIASAVKFSIIPPLGVQDAESYQGQPIFINVTDNSGMIHRIFTGYIDTPSLDIIDKKITFDCTDRRQTQILALPSSVISSVGQFSQDVFGQPKDNADELSDRLMTVAASFDFDNYGNYQLTPWSPKTSADFVIDDSTIYYNKPDVTFTNRTKTLNTINITVNYRYQRLHQQVANVVWSGYQDFINDWFSKGTPTFPQRTSISSSASATSWSPIGPINFIALWPAGAYSGIVWQPNTIVNTYVARTQITYLTPPVYNPVDPLVWPDGTKHAIETYILDASGQKIYDVGTSTVTDTSSPLCRGAQWIAGKKFAQTVNELYTIKISSPQGVSRFGIIDSHETVNINDPYNTAVWIGNKEVYNSLVISGTAINCTTNAAGYPIGTTTITLAAGGTGDFNTGNQFTITNDTSGIYYTVVNPISDISSGGNLLFTPALKVELPAELNEINLVPGIPNISSNFYINQKPLYANLISALSCVCQRGQTSLLSAHRDVSVNFKRSIWPVIDLIHTVETSSDFVATKGKVYSVNHTIDCGTGEAVTDVTLRLSRSYGGDTQSVFNIVTPPYEDSSYIGSPTEIDLSTHYGINPNPNVTPIAITWNGYIGNSTPNSSGLANTRTSFPESFIVDYPAIPLPITQDKTVTQNPPGINNGVTTDNAGYLQGVTSVNINTNGTGQLLQGDSITISGDNSSQVYIVQNSLLDVSLGGILSISPGLGANLSAITHTIISSPPGNQFTIAIPNDDLTVTF